MNLLYNLYMSELKKMQKQILAFRDARDWKQFHNPKDLAISLVLEATEVLEHFQWTSQNNINDYIKSHKNEIGEELADTLYWILLMAQDLEIDLFDAFDKKMIKNELKYPVKQSKGSSKKYTEFCES